MLHVLKLEGFIDRFIACALEIPCDDETCQRLENVHSASALFEARQTTDTHWLCNEETSLRRDWTPVYIYCYW